MASRYSGNLKISVKVNRANTGHDVNVSRAGALVYRCTVTQPPADKIALDASEAYDAAAKAALAFAENDGVDVSDAMTDDVGFVVSRQK